MTTKYRSLRGYLLSNRPGRAPAFAQYSTQSRWEICGCRCPFERIPSDLTNTSVDELVEAESTRCNPLYKASHLTDGDERPVTPADDARTCLSSIWQEQHFDVVELKETIEKGQRISAFTIDVAVNGQWTLWGWLNRWIPPFDQRANRLIYPHHRDAQVTPILQRSLCL